MSNSFPKGNIPHNKISIENIEIRLSSKNFKLIGQYINSKIKTLVECHCGRQWNVAVGNLLSGHVKSCGICSGPKKFVDYTGKIFGRLEVLEQDLKRQQDKNRTCWLCKCNCDGKIISVTTSRLRNEDTSSCGCLQKEKAANQLRKLHPNQKGKNNPSYKSELTEEDRIDRRCLPENYKWVKAVLLRDNYTCVKCDKRGGNLHAHHLDGYHWCKERRFDLSNGVTLCEDCHKDFHSKYGNSNNTEEQFKEYINWLLH